MYKKNLTIANLSTKKVQKLALFLFLTIDKRLPNRPCPIVLSLSVTSTNYAKRD